MMTLLGSLDHHVRSSPNQPAFHFLNGGVSDSVSTLTYRELGDRADAVADTVAGASAPGSRAILALRPGLGFVAALLGTMRAGVTVVPAFPPSNRRAMGRLLAIARDCDPALLLHDLPGEDVPSGVADAAVSMRPLRLDDVPTQSGSGTKTRRAHAGPALIQYTSGSTAEPKGVMLTDGNLASNCEAMTRRLGGGRGHVGVSWLPPYHDMGLIGTILLALYNGWPLVLLSPEHFVQSPVRWLRAITAFGATLTVSPNAGLAMCTAGIDDEDLPGLDLRSLRHLYCGAEPVERATLAAFRDRFARCGYREDSLVPCYGLAEATLFVAGKRPGDPVAAELLDKPDLERGIARPAESEGTTVVGCGPPPDGTVVRIVHPETRAEQSDGTVGEIWISGPGVGLGYYGRPGLSDRVFRAALASPGRAPRFLRSGDLGYLRDGALFVTGRISDLIVVAGRNLHPQDIERSVERAHPSLTRAAAFAVRVDAEERIVIIAELRRGRTACGSASIEHGILATVGADHGVRPSEVVLVPPGSIPTTTSGKKRRGEARALFLAGALPRLRAVPA